MLGPSRTPLVPPRVIARRYRWLLLAVVASVITFAALPASAQAHAALRTTSPAAGSTVATAPAAVTLRFSGSVSVDAGAIQVFATDGSRLDTQQAHTSNAGRLVTQPVRPAAAGLVSVAWRVTSADGHTERGSFSFTVGTASTGAPDDNASNAATRATAAAAARDRPARWVAGVGRFLTFLGVLGAVGGVIFTCVIAPGIAPRRVRIMVTVALLGLAATYLADAAITRGLTLSGALTTAALRAEAQHPYGRAALVTGALCVLALIVLPMSAPRRDGQPATVMARVAGCTVFLALAASISLAGHAIVTPPVGVRLSLDMLHVICAAAWLGGLIQLAYLTSTADRHVAVIDRFSALALGCVIVLLCTGAAATYMEFGSAWRHGARTQYGHIVLAKLLLYAGLIPFAVLNRTTLVPALRARPAESSRLLRQYIGRELVLLVCIVALTAWLTGSDPRT